MDPDYGVLEIHIEGQKVELVQCDATGGDFY